jgi:hypothetical protein
MKDLQRGRQDLKNLKRGINDPGSLKKVLKFSKRLLAKKGIVVASGTEEGQEMTPPISETRLEDSGKENILKDKHVLEESTNSQVLK